MDKSVIIGNMEKRGWVPVGPDDDWQVYWASTQTCRQVCDPNIKQTFHTNMQAGKFDRIVVDKPQVFCQGSRHNNALLFSVLKPQTTVSHLSKL